ncbi:MAG: hypothetical protein KC547_11340 [Anaerolineae bacterium]|nr:hypothetical protein [Anaerolineae bacterium]
MNMRTKADAELMAALDITQQDLDANRAGRLSQRQRERLEGTRRFWDTLDRLTKIASPILIGLTILDGIRLGDTVSSRAAIIGLICILALIFFLYVGSRRRSLDRDLSTGDVTSIEGIAKLTKFRRRNGVRHRISIGQEHFDVPSHVFMAFEDGTRYIVYFISHSRKMIAAEGAS